MCIRDRTPKGASSQNARRSRAPPPPIRRLGSSGKSSDLRDTMHWPRRPGPELAVPLCEGTRGPRRLPPWRVRIRASAVPPPP
eukprot:6346028-Alexandrium_andersonii.AAC.1